MDDLERDKIMASAELLRQRETAAQPWEDPYSDMSSEEKSKLITELYRLLAAREAHSNSLMEKLDQSLSLQRTANEELRCVREMMITLQKENAELRARNVSLEEQLKVRNKNTYSSRAQHKKKGGEGHHEASSREEEANDFDGTTPPPSCAATTDAAEEGKDTEVRKEKEPRLYRMGLKYRKMNADKTICHPFDRSRIPEGAVVIKYMHRYAYEQRTEIFEHDYELARCKMPDGTIRDIYCPKAGEPEYMDIIPGTHASASLLSYLIFNKYVLDTPLYREIMRIEDERMRVSRMTLTNWLEKGSTYIAKLVEFLKEKCLEKDSVVNCDETWCRVKVKGHYRKKYIWCLVNKEARIVIYCYEKGSRSRDALKDILGDSQVKSLQSDGYNVYMFLDDKMVDIEHLCCLAHARAKFWYAYEQGGDLDAKEILDIIKELYDLEAQYEKEKLTSEQITKCRQSLETKEIVIRLRSKLDALTAEGHAPRGELMEKALNYLKTFWVQLFAYQNDGRYSIDNNIAERNIRPLAGERKNSLFFGSDKMASVSALYHTVISTCRAKGLSALEFLKDFFSQVVQGSVNYEQVALSLIGSPPNKS